MLRNKRVLFLLSLLCVTVFLLSQCFQNNQIISTDPRGAGFAGATTCRQCHQAVYDAYSLSTHYNTTRPTTAKTVSGSFAPGSNRFHFNDSTYIALEDRDSGFYQAAYINGQEQRAHRMDIQFGGKHAETFLYWKGDQTFEHPLSFFKSLNAWATSPGFSATQINYNRFIGVNCFQCHSSFVSGNRRAALGGVEEVLDRSTLIFGIDCERCHGPSINHVNYHNAFPEVKEAKYMTRIKALSRQQKLDVC
ncbi:MAG TPA: multiheme c-type cytochrome, partial [Flavisolibacter sp.]|nr:multiheme c-type cytochrome [Flavisolibacter sp.]